MTNEMIERRPLTGLYGRKLHLKTPDPKKHPNEVTNRMIFLCSHYGKVEAMVCMDDLFDRDGNRFFDDRD